MFSHKELDSLCTLNEDQIEHIKYLQLRIHEFYSIIADSAENIERKAYLKDQTMEFIPKLPFSSLVRFILLDPSIRLFCKTIVPKDYWKKYFEHNTIYNFHLHPRDDLDAFGSLFGQVISLVSYLE